MMLCFPGQQLCARLLCCLGQRPNRLLEVYLKGSHRHQLIAHAIVLAKCWSAVGIRYCLVDTMQEQSQRWEETLKAVDTLISGKKRSDGKNWSHAFDMMDLFLEVSQ